MSICSDVYITLEKAREMVLKELMYEQTKLVKKAIEAMDVWELSHIINRDSDIYYYNIETNEEIEDEEWVQKIQSDQYVRKKNVKELNILVLAKSVQRIKYVLLDV